MNTDLIDIIEVLINKWSSYRHLCRLFGPNNKCTGISCNECLLNTNKIYVSDYPIRIIQIRELV
jgi:hypothetical protein|nr:MAG TPA: hypothetical protein [Caudoviricetes sp.]